MKVKANGIDINYQIDGPDGAPWIVFSNSLATSIAMWDEQAAGLKDSFRVLRYDQRGHGGTDVPAGRYAFDTLLADALALMDALSIKKAHFAGLSMGGATALGLAERHPDRFDRIIVCDSPCQSTPQSSAAMGGAHRGGAETGHRGAWSSRRWRAGFRPRPWQRTRRISTRCAPCSAPRRSTASSAAPRRWPTTTTLPPSPR